MSADKQEPAAGPLWPADGSAWRVRVFPRAIGFAVAGFVVAMGGCTGMTLQSYWWALLALPAAVFAVGQSLKMLVTATIDPQAKTVTIGEQSWSADDMRRIEIQTHIHEPGRKNRNDPDAQRTFQTWTVVAMLEPDEAEEPAPSNAEAGEEEAEPAEVPVPIYEKSENPAECRRIAMRVAVAFGLPVRDRTGKAPRDLPVPGQAVESPEPAGALDKQIASLMAPAENGAQAKVDRPVEIEETTDASGWTVVWRDPSIATVGWTMPGLAGFAGLIIGSMMLESRLGWITAAILLGGLVYFGWGLYLFLRGIRHEIHVDAEAIIYRRRIGPTGADRTRRIPAAAWIGAQPLRVPRTGIVGVGHHTHFRAPNLPRPALELLPARLEAAVRRARSEGV